MYSPHALISIQSVLVQNSPLREGWTGGLGLAYEHWSIWNDWPTGTCCIAQRTLPNSVIIYVEKKSARDGCVYMYNGIILLYSRNHHNLINQLYFNKISFFKKNSPVGGLNISNAGKWLTTFIHSALLPEKRSFLYIFLSSFINSSNSPPFYCLPGLTTLSVFLNLQTGSANLHLLVTEPPSQLQTHLSDSALSCCHWGPEPHLTLLDGSQFGSGKRDSTN